MGTQQRTRLCDFSRYKSCVVKSYINIKRGCVIFLVTKVASSITKKNLPKQLYPIWFWGLLAFSTDLCIKLAINGVCELVALPLNSNQIMTDHLVTNYTH
jgi:hypothetical protein